jgi:transcriptional regulator with XRE-family HTH domain
MEKKLAVSRQKRRKLFLPLLRGARKGAGLTQPQLAAILGVPQSFVSKYESGERRLDLAELSIICDALGVSFLSLVERFALAVKERN